MHPLLHPLTLVGAYSNHAAGLSCANVIRDAETGHVVGYVTLSAGQIARAALPKPLQRNKRRPAARRDQPAMSVRHSM